MTAATTAIWVPTTLPMTSGLVAVDSDEPRPRSVVSLDAVIAGVAAPSAPKPGAVCASESTRGAGAGGSGPAGGLPRRRPAAPARATRRRSAGDPQGAPGRARDRGRRGRRPWPPRAASNEDRLNRFPPRPAPSSKSAAATTSRSTSAFILVGLVRSIAEAGRPVAALAPADVSMRFHNAVAGQSGSPGRRSPGETGGSSRVPRA